MTDLSHVLHGAHCACPRCEYDDLLDEEIGKAFARAAEWSDVDDCD